MVKSNGKDLEITVEEDPLRANLALIVIEIARLPSNASKQKIVAAARKYGVSCTYDEIEEAILGQYGFGIRSQEFAGEIRARYQMGQAKLRDPHVIKNVKSSVSTPNGSYCRNGHPTRGLINSKQVPT